MKEAKEKQKVSERIITFLNQNTNFTLATCLNNIPHCANCFYTYDAGSNLLIFKSKPDTNHIQQALENKMVAGTIMPDKLDRTKIQGIQFRGFFLNPSGEQMDMLKKAYYKKYPFAISFSGNIWAIEFTSIKMTDNTLGFGKKIQWEK